METKARLVALGFQDETVTKNSVLKDSPTCAKEALRLLLVIISARTWTIHSLDVKSAFLQGKPIERVVFLRPPPEAKAKGYWKLLKWVYGLDDASRQWYHRVREA